MFDVFYSGKKPGLFAHERRADSVEHAQTLSRTRYFWWVQYLADYTNFDFLWEPVPWQSEFVHAWPSQWHEHSGTYLVRLKLCACSNDSAGRSCANTPGFFPE